MLFGDEKPRIAILTTGGTIDKEYGNGAGVTDLHIGKPYAPARLRELVGDRANLYEMRLKAKDSLDLNDTDRAEILGECQKRSEIAIVITHGTDTMLDTAAVLHEAGLGNEKTIILTGALRPAAMRDTDADFNLGLAYAAALLATPGIYIALNGVARWDEVVKDPTTGRLVPRRE